MSSPLADRIRPKVLDDVVGQKHLLGPGKPLRRIIESGTIPNLIFYGPSGIGKTTVASIIAKRSGKKLYKLNATTCSTADIREMLASTEMIGAENGILLYLDEIQYFNKKQQQTLLESIENGDITLIASTTENPYFYVYNAILSRSTVFEFKTLTPEDIRPAVIGFDILFSSEKENETDQLFAERCAQYGNVVTGFSYVFTRAVTTDENGNLVADAMSVQEKVLPYAALSKSTEQGFVNALMDEDDSIIRSTFLYFDEKDGTRVKSFSSAV